MSEDPHKLSRQRLWQKRMAAEGRCIICATKTDLGTRCALHLALFRTDNRNRYRKRHGIPLDAPIVRGRKRTIGVIKPEDN